MTTRRSLLPSPGQRSILAATAVATAVALVSCGSAESGPDAATPPAASAPTATPTTATPTTEAAPSPLGAIDAVHTVVITDEGNVGSGARWPDLLAATLEGRGVPMSVDTTAADGGGFDAAAGFERLIEQNAIGSTQLVVLFDSRLDADDAAVVGEAARRTFVAVERAAPDALLVVVGPLADADGGDALAAAAHDGGATYVDPVADGWPVTPTQPQLAELLLPHVEPLASALAASGANR